MSDVEARDFDWDDIPESMLRMFEDDHAIYYLAQSGLLWPMWAHTRFNSALGVALKRRRALRNEPAPTRKRGWPKGRPRSAASRAAISASLRGRAKTPEHRQAISEGQKARYARARA